MKAYAITQNTAKTGLIEEIEGQVHEASIDTFMVKHDGELNKYYRTWVRDEPFPTGEFGSIDGYWFATREDAVIAAKNMAQSQIKQLSFQIKLLKGVKFL